TSGALLSLATSSKPTSSRWSRVPCRTRSGRGRGGLWRICAICDRANSGARGVRTSAKPRGLPAERSGARARLPPSRRGPRGVASERALKRARDGASRAGNATRTSLASRAADARYSIERRPRRRRKPDWSAMRAPARTSNQQVVPRPVRPLDERAFRFFEGNAATMAMTETRELPKAYVPADFEAGIYERWLAA